MKNIIKISILALLLVGCVGTASAGLFDFGDDGTTEHDFGEFTLKVPENGTYEEIVQPNSNDSVSQLAEKQGKSSLSVEFNDSKWTSSEYKEFFHPLWSDDKNKIFIEHINYAEDNLSSSDVVESCFSGVTLEDSQNGDDIYYWNDFEDYIVKKDSNDGSQTILVRSPDKELAKKVADTVNFK